MTATILNESDLTPAQSRYWRACARKKAVDVVDPFRHGRRWLDAHLPVGTRVYRASTGGRWGKSADVYVTKSARSAAKHLEVK